MTLFERGWNTLRPKGRGAPEMKFRLIPILLLGIGTLTVTNPTTGQGQACRFLLDGCDARQIPQQPANLLVYSPWTKFCVKGKEAKQVCFTGKDGRGEPGIPVVAAVLIEPERDPKKVLRVTLPLGMSIQQGTRVIVDNGQPMTSRYVICFNNGCMADYEANGDLIRSLHSGRGLTIQGINGAGQAISFVVPLQDFAKAYDGPPTDPKKFEEQRKQLQEELQRRAKAAAGGGWFGTIFA
jgi:invasion protein IalB